MLFSSAIFNANAALIDNGNFTTDTTQGLDWLDLSATAEMSYADAIGANSGWRLATNFEVEKLFGQVFPNYVSNTASDSSFLSPEQAGYTNQAEEAQSFISLFGDTKVGGPPTDPTLQSFGHYQDEGGIWRIFGAQYRESQTGAATSTVFGLNNTVEYSAAGSDDTGILLVRTSVVPLPAAAWLFGSALAGLGWLRRKQTA